MPAGIASKMPPVEVNIRAAPRKSLETLIEYQIEQGILEQKPDIESLFFPRALSL